ncbi:MAG TPA: CBS domain-containing protein, partial [Thermoplasmata archaeon]|nr:CBS domain-containing protein [Thermoplasmata archaeon]
GISQMPVLAGSENVGSVQEEEALRRSLDDGTVLDRTVNAVLLSPFPEVTADATVADLLRRLREERAVLVRDPTTHAPIGVLTRHDLVGFLSEGDHNAV